MSEGCPTPCDHDCEALCHEAHKPRWKRSHIVKVCERYRREELNLKPV